jgi:chromosome segregation ATPase
MKTYITLIKQVKSEIEMRQKALNQVQRDKTNLEQQIDHMLETFEREQIEVSLHKVFFNPKYFDRISNKIKVYRNLLQSKLDEFQTLQDEILALFSKRKQYETLLKNYEERIALEHQKKEAQELEDLFRPASKSLN